MKFKVQYYDIETDKVIEKDCFEFFYYGKEDKFSFIAVDNPVTGYKSTIIDRPAMNIGYMDYGKLEIVVEGYQMIKNCGYLKTKTTITSVEKE